MLTLPIGVWKYNRKGIVYLFPFLIPLEIDMYQLMWWLMTDTNSVHYEVFFNKADLDKFEDALFEQYSNVTTALIAEPTQDELDMWI